MDTQSRQHKHTHANKNPSKIPAPYITPVCKDSYISM
jgi:hypothetical protein